MATSTPNRADRLSRSYGVGLVLLGLATFMLSLVFERGFVHGLFQGMTIALMVLAVYLIGKSVRRGPEAKEEEMWRPSRDEK